jgi:hypothetical protein
MGGSPVKEHRWMVREHADANSGARIALDDEMITPPPDSTN